jgi:hypothetical protein
MSGLKVRVLCKDCDRERIIDAVSQIIPIVGNYYCLSDGKDSESNRCACGCEAFHVVSIER